MSTSEREGNGMPASRYDEDETRRELSEVLDILADELLDHKATATSRRALARAAFRIAYGLPPFPSQVEAAEAQLRTRGETRQRQMAERIRRSLGLSEDEG